MRLAVLIAQPFWFDGRSYSTNAPVINFILSFAAVVDELVIFTTVMNDSSERGNFGVILADNVRIVHLPFSKNISRMYLQSPLQYGKIRRIFERELDSWDVGWVIEFTYPERMFLKMAKKAGKPVFMYIRSSILGEVESHRYTGLKKIAADVFAENTHGAIVKALKTTPAFVTGSELHDLYGGDGGRVYKVYPSILTEADIAAGDGDGVHERFTIVCVGRLTPEKGLETMVEAVGLLVGEGRDVLCRLVGTGKDAAALRQLVEDNGLAGNFSFAGFVPPGKQLFAEYDAADVYAMSSRTEGLPKTLYEAMARGLPVVSTDVGGISEIVKEGENGLLVPPGDSRALAGALARLMDEPALRARLGRAGLAMAGGYTVEKQRDRMFENILELFPGVPARSALRGLPEEGRRPRIAVLIDQPFWLKDGRYTTNAPIINFILSFSEVADRVLIIAPVSDGDGGFFPIETDSRVKFAPLPFFYGTLQMYLRASGVMSALNGIIKRESDTIDVFWVVDTHLPQQYFIRRMKKLGKATFFYIRSNLLEQMRNSNREGANRLLAMTMAWLSHWLTKSAVGNGMPAFVTGRELVGLYGSGLPWVYRVYESLLLPSDIVEKKTVTHEVFTIVCVGRISAEKGLEVLVSAVEILTGEGLDVRCRVVGAGYDEERIRMLVGGAGLDGRFDFVGFIPPGPELFREYDKGDVYVICSHTEGLPKTVYEAQARALPVVATDVGGIPDLVVDGVDGLLVPPADPKALAAAVRRIMEDTALSERLGAAGAEKALGFTLRAQRDRMLARIIGIIERQGGRG